MEKYHDYTRARLAQLATRMRKLIYAETLPISRLQVSDRQESRISYGEAQKLKGWRPAAIGQQFGPLWSTYWFRAEAEVPAHWKGRRVDLLWESHSEATLWVEGRAVQGLNHTPMSFDKSTRPDAVLARRARGGETLNFQVEMACNKLFGYDEDFVPHYTSISAYVLDRADIALFDAEAWDLYFDFAVLQELDADGFAHKDLEPAWNGHLLSELNRFANSYDPDDRRTWKPARQILRKLYENHNGTYVHDISLIGHAHIDTAWLWPIGETRRKCVRSFSSQLAYMADYPEYKFACSQAQQYEWVAQDNPELFGRIKKAAKRGQWVPVGGTWIEPDCNIPSGESLVRQFLLGQRYFEREFGARCVEFWNPDVFGYNGQLPQICQGAGISRFVTQKLSWNRFNKPRHQTFIWEGIDGSEVFTHFPPADNYNATPDITTLREAVRRYKDSDRSRYSLMPFGYGDGGGGPTKAMLETVRRTTDLQGVARTTMRTPAEFFDLLETDCTDRVRMLGELYFEYHRGTYTSQAATKRGNRQCENLLHEVEFMSAVAEEGAARGYSYPAAALENLWKLVLLNQFHDILPGSSIRLVYEDTERQHAQVREEAQVLKDRALAALIKQVPTDGSARERAVVNTTAFDRTEVVTQDGALAWAEAPAYGVGATTATHHVVITEKLPGGGVALENSYLRAELAADGTLVSLLEKESDREALAASGNQWLIYDDVPTAWAAWDVDPQHMETERAIEAARGLKITLEHDLRAEVTFTQRISDKSTARQVVRLDAGARRLEFHCTVDWHETNRMLKVAFPLNVRATGATYEMQFGAVERPNHFNTTHDLARFEVPGHRWADMSEHGFGVALLNDSKYGWSAMGNTLRLSLLRSPKHPDPECDMGRHEFAYAIMPHGGRWQEAGLVAEATAFNLPLCVTGSTAPAKPVRFFTVTDSAATRNLVLDTIKRAEDGDGTVLRFYECHGGTGTARVQCARLPSRAWLCNLLEDEETELAIAEDGAIELTYRPWQIITVKLSG